MEDPHSAGGSPALAGSEDVRRLFRNLDDHAVASILALKPTLAQLEEAAARVAGAGEIFSDIRPAKGVVEAILDLAVMEDEEFDDR